MSTTAYECASRHRDEIGSATESVDVDAWYRQYGDSVLRRCLALTDDWSCALDLMQEVFLRAHRFKDSYRGEAKPLGWLYAITNRCFADSLRNKHRVDTQELVVFLREEEDGLEVALTRHALVASLLGRVPPEMRDIVIYRFFDDLQIAEIAKRLGINEKTVRRKLERFLKSARKILTRGRS
ncbi:RNA polymerase sigma factor [Myxococcota bacterium]